MPLGQSDYPLLEVIWTILLFFVFIMWIWLVIKILVDIFRRDDISGWLKAGWTAFIIFLPLLGVLVYVIAQGKGMGERDMAQLQAQQASFDNYVQSVAGSGGGASAEIAKAKQLLDSGAISQEEFDALKAKAPSS